MEVPVILQNLNQYHQMSIERDEIQNFREDVLTLINETTEKGLFKVTKNQADHIQSLYTKKLNSLLPQISKPQRLDIYNLIAKHSDIRNLSITVPTALLRIENMSLPFLIQTLSNGKIISRPCRENEFFRLKFDITEEVGPLFCYKVQGKETIVFYDVESALSM